MKLRIPLVGDLIQAYNQWQEDDGNLMAAAVAYYAALSFFPLLLVLISGIGLLMQFTHWGNDAQQEILKAIGEYASPNVRENVALMLGNIERNAAVGGPVGIVFLLFAAAAMFAQFEYAFDRMWNVPEPESRGILRALRNIAVYRIRAFLMLLAIGLLILVIFAANVVLNSVRRWTGDYLPGGEVLWSVLQALVTVGLNAAALTLLYRLLPKIRVRWREAARGGLFTAIGWEIVRTILSQFVVGNRYNAYGIVGSFIAVMLWIYFASALLFLGGEYVQVLCQRSGLARRRRAAG